MSRFPQQPAPAETRLPDESTGLHAVEAALALAAESDKLADGNLAEENAPVAEPAKAMASLAAMREIETHLRRSNRVLITSHARPDGDAVGSVLSMAAILDQLGTPCEMVLADPVPQAFHRLPGVHRIAHAPKIDATRYDLAVVLECDSTERTGLDGLHHLPIVNIDHHLTSRDYGVLNWVDPAADAVAAMVYHLARQVHIEITPGMATCLYAALLTDTGAFTYPGTSADTFQMAHELIQLGARADSVARDVLYSVPAARIRLLGAVLSRAEMADGVAWSYVTQADLAHFSATEEDSEGIVNYLISVDGIEAAAFLRELPGTPQRFRVSFRSKSSLDVSGVAQRCGGGGHRNAAGCTLDGPLETAVERTVRELSGALQDERTRLSVDGSEDAAGLA